MFKMFLLCQLRPSTAEIVTPHHTVDFNQSTPINDDYDMNLPPLPKRNIQDESDIGHSSDRLFSITLYIFTAM